MITYTEINKCRVCNNENLKEVFSLGDLYVSNFVKKNNLGKSSPAPLELVLCMNGCGLLQLRHTVSASEMYEEYWYRSGINKTMTDELHDIVEDIESRIALSNNDHVIDIGANDGTLLRAYGSNIKKIGFEPAKNLAKFNSIDTTKIFQDFFSYKLWSEEYGEIKAKVITAIGMFYDLDNPNSFVKDIYSCLDDNGIFIIQMMYLPSFLERNAFDGICHEHLEYYSFSSLSNLLEKHGLKIFDVLLKEDINEGSARFYIKKANSKITINYECHERVNKIKTYEENLDLNSLQTYKEFHKRIELEKQKVMGFLESEVRSGKKIHGYAASTKGNTTLQYYGIGTDIIESIADRNPEKFGTYTIGTEIPVISEEDSRSRNPDYYFVLAWHFIPEFLKREKDFLRNGGKFIVPMPYFKLLDKDTNLDEL